MEYVTLDGNSDHEFILLCYFKMIFSIIYFYNLFNVIFCDFFVLLFIRRGVWRVTSDVITRDKSSIPYKGLVEKRYALFSVFRHEYERSVCTGVTINWVSSCIYCNNGL